MNNELQEHLCKKCDYRNNDVAISRKKPNYKGIDQLINCETYTRTVNLKSRIDLLNGKIGPLFICGKNGCEIDTFED